MSILYPVSSNAMSPKALFPLPKGSIPLAQRLYSPCPLHFRLSYCSLSLCSIIQRLHLILYFTCSTKVSPVFKLSCRSRIISVVFPLPFDLCAPPRTLRLSSPHRFSSRRPSFIIVPVVVLASLDTIPNPFIALIITMMANIGDVSAYAVSVARTWKIMLELFHFVQVLTTSLGRHYHYSESHLQSGCPTCL